MNPQTRFPGQSQKKHSAVFLLLASPLLVAHGAGGPGVIANPGAMPEQVPAAVEDTMADNPMNVFVPAGTFVDKSLPQPFQFGQITVRPHVDYSVLYSDAFPTTPTNRASTFIQQLSPGIAVDLGRHWTVDYTPTIRFYSSSQLRDGVDHSLSLIGGTSYEDWVFGLTQSFGYTTAPTYEIGAQTEQEQFGTGLTASHSLSDKVSLDLGLNQTISDSDGLQGSREWSTLDWLNYQFWSRLSAGLGVGLGYDNVDFGPDQTFEQIQGRVNWRLTDNLSLQLSGGGEDRQYASSPQPDSFTPIFSAGIQYLPFRDTQISFAASRSISPSLIPGSDSTSTSFNLNLNQTLFKKFNLSLGAGYTISKYTEIAFVPIAVVNNTLYGSLLSQNRTDDLFSFSARVSHPFLKRGTWSVYYQYSDNESTEAGFGYPSSQVGFEIGYHY